MMLIGMHHRDQRHEKHHKEGGTTVLSTGDGIVADLGLRAIGVVIAFDHDAVEHVGAHLQSHGGERLARDAKEAILPRAEDEIEEAAAHVGGEPIDGLAIAAALRLIKGMGLRFAKTFNSQQGGQTSAEAFFNGTLSDWERVAQRVPSAASGGASSTGGRSYCDSPVILLW